MPVCEVLLQLSQESSCQAHLRRKCEIRHLYVCSIHHVCTKERDHTKQGSKGEIQQDSLLYCHGNPTLMKSRKTIKYLKKKKKRKSLCYEYLLGWEKMHSWKEHDIFTIWWCLLTKPRVQLSGKADWKNIPFTKLFNSSCC